MLRLELEALREVDFNFELTGFDAKELERLIAEQQKDLAGLLTKTPRLRCPLRQLLERATCG